MRFVKGKYFNEVYIKYIWNIFEIGVECWILHNKIVLL